MFTNDQAEIVRKYVPETFFSSNETDPIGETLDLLPSADSPDFARFVEERYAGESESLDIISKTLNDNLIKNYSSYIESMQMISDLNHQLNMTTSNIRQTRQVMLSAESEICDHPRSFFRQIAKKKNLSTVIDLVTAVNAIHKSTDELNSAIKSRNFVHALELCRKPAELSGDIRKLSGVEGLISSLQNMYSRIQDEMDRALAEQTEVYDREVYGNLIKSYETINKLNTVPQRLLEAFMTRSKQAQDRIGFSDISKIKQYKNSFDSLIDICSNISKVHQQILIWHRSTKEFEVIRKAIEEMSKTLWDRNEAIVSSLLLKAPVDQMNFEHFNQLLKSTACFLQFGSTVVDLPGGQLSNATVSLSSTYFKLFHKGSMEAIRQVIEQDTWERCPNGQEFVRQILSLSIPIKDSHDGFRDSPQVSSGMASMNIASAGNFDLSLCSNSLSKVLKILHNYLTLMKAVPSLASEAFKGMQQLVEFYSLSVLHLFLRIAPLKPLEINQEGKIVFSSQCSVLLTVEGMQSLARIVNNFQESQMILPIEGRVSTNTSQILFQICIASDDMKALAWYMKSIRPIIEESLPEGSLGGLKRFFSNVVSVYLNHFTRFTIPFYGPSLIDLQDFENQLKSVKWTLTEPPSDPHSFTKSWTAAAEAFSKLLPTVKLNPEYNEEAWISIWNFSMFTLINGLSNTTKCTAEGRTAMLSDFRNISHDFSSLTQRKIQFDSTWISEFIQAFFFNIDDFRNWAQNNCKRYTMGHLLSIVETGLSDGIKRQDKRDLTTFIRGLFKESTN